MELFKVDRIEFSSTSQKIVKNVSLSIEKGDVTAFLGKSGSGKSTLMKLIAGILNPTSGKVFFEGKDLYKMSKTENKEFRKRCAYVFQDSALWENQTIEQNLSLPLQTHNQHLSLSDRKNKILEICDKVGFHRSLSLRPVDLSMGEQKRIAFARAFINNPEILFLDECIASLDKHSSEVIIELISNFIKKGNTVSYISHNQEFIDIMSELGKESHRSVIYEVDNGFLLGADNYEI